MTSLNQQLGRLERCIFIPPTSFENQKPFILIEIPFWDRNVERWKDFIRKLHEFTNDKFKIPTE